MNALKSVMQTVVFPRKQWSSVLPTALYHSGLLNNWFSVSIRGSISNYIVPWMWDSRVNFIQYRDNCSVVICSHCTGTQTNGGEIRPDVCIGLHGHSNSLVKIEYCTMGSTMTSTNYDGHKTITMMAQDQSINQSWCLAISRSLLPLRSFAWMVCPPLAAGPRSLIHPCHGRSGEPRW